MSLIQQAKSGLLWSAVSRFGLNGLIFVKGIILARLLGPEDFGLLAMVSVFTVIATGVTDFGFSQSVIQKKDLSHADQCTAFYANTCIGALMALLLAYSAPQIAAFYHEERLVPIMRGISVATFIAALGQVHRAGMIRELRFKRAAIIKFPPIILSLVVVVALALRGWGVWALIVGYLLEKLITTLILWCASGWRPTFMFSTRSFIEMLPFGSRLAALSVLGSIFDNIYVLVIGRYFPPVDVGYYQRAKSFNHMGSESLSSIVGKVAFPVLSRMQEDLQKIARLLIASETVLALMFFPVMALMAGAAKPLIVMLVGEKWLPVVPYLQLLVISGALFPLNTIMVNAMKAYGRAGLILNLAIFRHCLTAMTIALTIRYGIFYMLIGKVIGDLLLFFLRVYFLSKLFPLGIRLQLTKVATVVPSAILIFTASSLIVEALDGYMSMFSCAACAFIALGIHGLYIVAIRGYVREELRSVAQHSTMLGRVFGVLYREAA